MPLKLYRNEKKSRYWYLRGTVRGYPVDESTRTDRRQTAEAIRIKREAEILERSIFGVRATATFLEASVGYLEAGGSKRYLQGIIDHFGTTPLHKIDQIAIDVGARELYPNGSNATRNRQFYTPVSAVLKWGASRRLCDYRPISRPRQPRGKTIWMTTEQAERLIDACSDWYRPIVIFMLYTGCRPGEAAALEWREIDLQLRRVIFLDTKNGEDRGVTLHMRVVAELAGLEHREGRVFLNSRGQGWAIREDQSVAIDKPFAKARKKAGLAAGITPHTCRHTWATWYYAETRDIQGLKELGGWKSDAMVARYTHVNPDHLRNNIDRLPWGESGESEYETAKTIMKQGA